MALAPTGWGFPYGEAEENGAVSGLPGVPLPCPHTSVSESLSLCSLIPPLPLHPSLGLSLVPSLAGAPGRTLPVPGILLHRGQPIPGCPALPSYLGFEIPCAFPCFLSHTHFLLPWRRGWCKQGEAYNVDFVNPTSQFTPVVGSRAPLCSGPSPQCLTCCVGIHFQFGVRPLLQPPLPWRGVPGHIPGRVRGCGRRCADCDQQSGERWGRGEPVRLGPLAPPPPG